METAYRVFLNQTNGYCEAAVRAKPKQSRNGIASADQPSGTGRPSGRPPLEQPASAFGLLAMTIVCLFIFSPILSAEEIPERIDGTVIDVNEKARILRVDFEHPATFERSEMEFYVPEGIGFKDFKKLKDLRQGDLVSLDYLNEGKQLKAVYVIRIPQEKTYFTRQEVAGALIKIKSNQKQEDEPEKN